MKHGNRGNTEERKDKMKLTLNGYDVEIKVKRNGRANNEETKYLLNEIALFADNSSRYYESEGANALAKRSQDFSDEIYTFLDEQGFYN